MKDIWIQTVAVAGYSFTATVAFIWKILRLETLRSNHHLHQKRIKKGM